MRRACRGARGSRGRRRKRVASRERRGKEREAEKKKGDSGGVCERSISCMRSISLTKKKKKKNECFRRIRSTKDRIRKGGDGGRRWCRCGDRCRGLRDGGIGNALLICSCRIRLSWE